MVPLVAIAFALQASPQVLAQGFTPSSIAEGQAQAQQAVMPAAVVATLPTSKQPPQLSAAQLASLEAARWGRLIAPESWGRRVQLSPDRSQGLVPIRARRNLLHRATSRSKP
jgi:hypothetical protein